MLTIWQTLNGIILDPFRLHWTYNRLRYTLVLLLLSFKVSDVSLNSTNELNSFRYASINYSTHSKLAYVYTHCFGRVGERLHQSELSFSASEIIVENISLDVFTYVIMYGYFNNHSNIGLRCLRQFRTVTFLECVWWKFDSSFRLWLWLVYIS